MKAAILALCLAHQAHAAVAFYVATEQRGRIELHDVRGPVCVGDALHAEFIPLHGDRIAGCWTIRGPIAAVVFFDGDTTTIPAQALRRPSTG